MLIVADENMALVEGFFADLGELRCYPGRQLSPEQVRDADILLVRSVTRVDARLLAGSRVRFVGSATIGADHLDLDWLASQGIGVSTAPGCNATSVVEYVITVLAGLAHRLDFSLETRVLGVVGLGNVGYRLVRMAQGLGLRVLGCDPFVDRPDVEQVGFAELLARADIVSLHTPLTSGGSYPTHHLIDSAALCRLRPGAVLLNSGRGAVIDNAALLQFLHERPGCLAAVALDVWEGEPLVDRALAAATAFATPHIAGYSLEGRWRGTEMVYQALCAFLGTPMRHTLADFLPAHDVILGCAPGATGWEAARALLAQAWPIGRDDEAFRATLALPDPERALAFDRLRRDYWPRREFSAYRVMAAEVSGEVADVAARLGFQI